MLDLDAIFNPDIVAPTRPVGQTPNTPASVVGPDDLPGDWRVEWEERAAIMEYDGKLPRERAEALALTEIVQAMQRAGVYPKFSS
jgi:hypothetical protein